MKILIACEFSGRVRESFTALGHDAWSCDLLPTEIPGNHIQDDVLLHLDEGWDMMVAFPPCTYLCGSGLHWNNKRPEREELTHQAMLFVLNLMGEGYIHHEIPRIALENPKGRISTAFRKPDQIIQPYQFGEDAKKMTCLWLKNLPLLTPTEVIPPTRRINGKDLWANQSPSGNNNSPQVKDRWKNRSRTYWGIARAMAEQWGHLT